jgi:hypothetical protein
MRRDAARVYGCVTLEATKGARSMKAKLLAALALSILLGLPGLAKAVPACRNAGHPCEGNQDCCSSLICVASGPGAAKRCTACPTGQIPCGNACIPACAASDQCHTAGVCDATTGRCTNPSKADGSSCSDGDACTQTDRCVGGSCSGSNPVVCNASDQCHVAGTCDSTTGNCSNPTKANDTPCNADGDACTPGDSCQNGVCTAGSAMTCGVCNACRDGACQPADDSTCATGCCNGTCCAAGDQCVDGECGAPASTPTETPAAEQTPTETPGGGGNCNPFTCLVGQTCCNGQCCDAGTQCVNGVCLDTGICIQHGDSCDAFGQPPHCCDGLTCRAAFPIDFISYICRDATCAEALEPCGSGGPFDDGPCCAGDQFCVPNCVGPFGCINACCSPTGGECHDLGRFFPAGDCCGTNVCNGQNQCGPCRQQGETCDSGPNGNNCCVVGFGGTIPLSCVDGMCVSAQ